MITLISSQEPKESKQCIETKIKSLVRGLIIEKRATDIRELRPHYREFFESLSADEKKFVVGELPVGMSTRAREKLVDETIEKLAIECDTLASRPGEHVTLTSRVSKIGLIQPPIDLLFESRDMPLGEFLKAGSKAEPLGPDEFEGKTGTIAIGTGEMWQVKINAERGGNYRMELLDKSVPGDAYQLFLDQRVTLCAEIARKTISFGEVGDLMDGSFLGFCKAPVKEINIYIEEYGVKIGKGIPVIMEPFTGISISCCDLIPALLSGGETAVHVMERNPSTEMKLIYGKIEISMRDLMCIETGTVYTLTRRLHEPCEVAINDAKLYGDVIVNRGEVGVQFVTGENGKPIQIPAESASLYESQVYYLTNLINRENEKQHKPEAVPSKQMRVVPIKNINTTSLTDSDICRKALPRLESEPLLDSASREILEGPDDVALAHFRAELYHFMDEHQAGMIKYMKESISKDTRFSARLFAVIGYAASSWILKFLSDEEIEKVVEEIIKLNRLTVSEAESAISNVRAFMTSSEFPTVTGIAYASGVLKNTIGAKNSSRMLRDLTNPQHEVRPFDFVDKCRPGTIREFLQGEHPQTIALVLSFLTPANSASILAGLPVKMQGDVAMRISDLSHVSLNVLREIERVLERKLSTNSSEDIFPLEGITLLAGILAASDDIIKKNIIGTIRERNPGTAGEVERCINAH